MDVSDPKAPRVLLVDDTPSNLIALVAVLQPIGAVLVEARSGQEAIDLVARNWFAAILIDVQMPSMDGFETAARIRATERGREVPILFLTAIHHEAVRCRDRACPREGVRGPLPPAGEAAPRSARDRAALCPGPRLDLPGL